MYIATCVGVVDLGEQYSEKFKNYRNEVQFIWELSGETVEVDGEVNPGSSPVPSPSPSVKRAA